MTPVITLRKVYQQNSELLIYQDLTGDPIITAFLEVCHLLGEGGENREEATGKAGPGGQSDEKARAGELAAACRRFFSLLAAYTELYPGQLTGDPWQNYLLDRLAEAENTFSLKAGWQGSSGMGAGLEEAARQDLRALQALAGTAQAACTAARAILENLPDWTRLQPLDPDHPLPPPAVARRRLKENLLAAADWGYEGLELLAEYYHTCGTGIFGSYWAFRWEHGPAGGRLAGIGDPDPITFNSLVGYEAERREVIHNTEKFLRGLPAVNVLLYGARGTGKSSTVKALLPAYGSLGLRLVELPKRYLSDYQEILKILAPRPQKFIIFIDDLSFEEDEVEYKELKGLLEGSLQVRPANVLVYATSNRRHLVKESFADRTFNPAGGEVRLQDTVQEKLSLAERFGLTVIFPSPDQEQYLAIVSELARQAGLEMEPAELRRRALQWALYQNGTSGRTARQFVDYLRGEQE